MSVLYIVRVQCTVYSVQCIVSVLVVVVVPSDMSTVYSVWCIVVV
jgi:hypothetical protein